MSTKKPTETPLIPDPAPAIEEPKKPENIMGQSFSVSTKEIENSLKDGLKGLSATIDKLNSNFDKLFNPPKITIEPVKPPEAPVIPPVIPDPPKKKSFFQELDEPYDKLGL